jgi:DNA-binding transcriptional ArsR family regulator
MPEPLPTRLDHTLLALADPTRRAIVQRLARSPQGEARVTELAAPFAISLNSVSKHIRILERARLLRRRCVGREHWLSLDPRPLDEAAAWMATQRALWTARLDALEAILRDEDAAAARGPASVGRASTKGRKKR